MHNTPVFEFTDCRGQEFTSDLDSETQYNYDGSDCFHYNESARHGEQHSEMVFIYITGATINISFYTNRIQGIYTGICNASCEYLIWEEILLNGSCSSYINSNHHALLQGQWPLCHNNNITGLTITIPPNEETMMIYRNDFSYEINETLTHYCTGKHYDI